LPTGGGGDVGDLIFVFLPKPNNLDDLLVADDDCDCFGEEAPAAGVAVAGGAGTPGAAPLFPVRRLNIGDFWAFLSLLPPSSLQNLR
jgi:hypothetical protein